jgi:hypothetical protein
MRITAMAQLVQGTTAEDNEAVSMTQRANGRKKYKYLM